MCTYFKQMGGRGLGGGKIRLDTYFSFWRRSGIVFGGANVFPSLVKVTLDGFVGRRSILGGVSVG